MGSNVFRYPNNGRGIVHVVGLIANCLQKVKKKKKKKKKKKTSYEYTERIKAATLTNGIFIEKA